MNSKHFHGGWTRKPHEHTSTVEIGKTRLIVSSHPDISLSRQTELLGISRASLYYKPRINEADLAAMAAIDCLFTKYPFYGVPRMQAALRRESGITIGRDHTRRLMRLMGLEAIYPKQKKNTSIPDDSHQKYPYLLNGITADHPNHIWGSDITYIRLEHGWCYLYAILDWYSRLVVGWELSATMETDFCIRALRNAIENYGIPEISNTDQGSQFTDKDFISVLKENNIRISMDGRGRCMDNIFTERLWRTVKYEEVYLKSYTDLPDARTHLAVYFPFYNHERPHQSLGYRTPAQVYLETKKEKSSTKIQILNNPNPSDLSTIAV